MKAPVIFLIALASGLLSPLSGLAAPAAPLDLGRNLTYMRLHRLPDDAALLTAAWPAPALIVDLRYPAGEAAPAMPAGLPPRPRTAPLFVLVGPATPVGLLAALRDRAPALITLGLPAPGLMPDIALAVKPEADRRAYDALDAGASIESLISEKITKPRFAEAELTHEHDSGATDDEGPGSDVEDRNDTLPAAAPPASPPQAPPSPAAPEAPLKDVVLVRAVQLHRALLALGKLPED